MTEYFKTHPTKQQNQIGELPVGYRNIERNEVDMKTILLSIVYSELKILFNV